MAGKLVADRHGAVDVATAGEDGDGGEQVKVFVHHLCGNETVRIFLGDEGGGENPRIEHRMAHQCRLEGGVGTDTANQEGVECLAHACDGLLAGVAVADQLGDH